MSERLPLPDLHADVRKGVRAMLLLAGRDPDDECVSDTPDRVLRAWGEMTAQPGTPESILSRTFPSEGAGGMVVVGPMPFTSVCEHHLLPFTGTAFFGYLPGERIVGLSKIPRLLHHFAQRTQVQERLTRNVLDAFVEHVPCVGAGVHVEAVHSCAALRGVRTVAPMSTVELHGAFRDEPETRAEFLAAVTQRHPR